MFLRLHQMTVSGVSMVYAKWPWITQRLTNQLTSKKTISQLPMHAHLYTSGRAYHRVLIVDFAAFYLAAETFYTIVLSNCPSLSLLFISKL